MERQPMNLSESQSRALARLEEEAQVDRGTWDELAGTPRFLRGKLLAEVGEDPQEIVQEFLQRYGDLFGIKSKDEYEILSIKQDTLGNQHVRVSRVQGSYRVYPSRLSFWIDPGSVLIRVKAHWPAVPDIRDQTPTVELDQAQEAAAKERPEDKFVGVVGEPRLEYHLFVREQEWQTDLAWNFVARFEGGHPDTEGFVVSATQGTVLLRYPDEDEVATTTTGIGINNADETAMTPVRTINVDDPGGGANLRLLDTSRSVDIETRDMAGATSSSGTYPFCEDDDGDGQFHNITNSPRNDSDRPEVDAHYNTGLMHDYLARTVTVNSISLFGRDGWKDDASQKWVSLVHKGTNSMSSSFSRSNRVLSHGDGDGTTMTYKPTLDTCAHEWSHALQAAEVTGGTNPNGGFDFTPDETFIIKEIIADIFACCINRDWGWRFGAIFEDDAAMSGATFSSTGSRLRGMRSPSTYGQPDHYYASADTLGGGYAGATSNYERCGILDKAGFLMAAGGTHPSAASDPTTYPPITVYGMGCGPLQNILYYTLANLSDPDDVFSDFRQDMIDAANTLYPSDTCKAQTVRRAFDAVGIYAEGSTPPAAPSGPDPMITPWGARTDVPPYWQSPDIYVKDAGGTIAAPLKGQVNRLFARVTNIGDADATGVSVTFSFLPYGAGTSGNAPKTIGTVTDDVPLGVPVEFEIAWDLTNLTDTNGGLWPLPLGDFDHFCVRAQVDHAADVDICNNYAQNNFANVETADADGDGIFLVGNSNPEVARWVALTPAHRISRGWRVKIDPGKLLAGIQPKPVGGKPWIGNAPHAVMVPLEPNELRPVEFGWSIDSREKYDGPVYGCLKGRVEGEKLVTGKLVAEIKHLILAGERFEATITGRIKRVRESVGVRGTLVGEVDRKSGEFRGEFEGRVSHRKGEEKAAFVARGVMAASASFSFVVMSLDDEQGLDLAVPLVGDLRSVCGKMPPPPVKE